MDTEILQMEDHLQTAMLAEDVDCSLAAGMNAHLQKPLLLPALADELRRWLPVNSSSDSA